VSDIDALNGIADCMLDTNDGTITLTPSTQPAAAEIFRRCALHKIRVDPAGGLTLLAPNARVVVSSAALDRIEE
jgi:FAD/FMN-containing dehydrogenase